MLCSANVQCLTLQCSDLRRELHHGVNGQKLHCGVNGQVITDLCWTTSALSLPTTNYLLLSTALPITIHQQPTFKENTQIKLLLSIYFASWEKMSWNLECCVTWPFQFQFVGWMRNPLIDIEMILQQNVILSFCMVIVSSKDCWQTSQHFHPCTIEREW